MIKALLVEDDEDFVALLRKAITKFHSPILLQDAGSLSEASKVLNANLENPFNFLIVDLNLPDGEGDIIIDTLRKNRVYKDVPFLIVSSEDEEILKSLSYKHKVDYIRKPVNFEQTCKFIEYIANRENVFKNL